ncbi:MAG: ferredoxin reductase [Dehalococcoidia bacterium]|nr:ferredoxin reductase [Dehalococcoidia bacterium]
MTNRSDPGTEWQTATVESVVCESPRVKLFRLKLPGRGEFRAGQYYDIRLSAPDGYQAQRSYSVTSSPDVPDMIELAIELIPGGEVSSFFHEAVEPGEQIELRGPIGGHFTWTPDFRAPVLLVAGGSGIAPMMSMLRHRHAAGSRSPMSLLYSVRTEPDILFRPELERLAAEDGNLDIVSTLTRGAPPGWTGETRRIDRPMIDSVLEAFGRVTGRAYVCGGTGFVEAVGSHLLDCGVSYNEIRTERFGP